MGSPNERAATEEPPVVVAGPAATAGRSINVPATETLGGGTTLAAAANNQTNHQQQSDQQESSDNGERNGSCASASQSAKTTATNVVDDFQPPLSQLLLDSDGVQQSSQSRKISNRSNSSTVSHHSHSENSQNGNSDSGDHQVTAGASNGTDSADVTSTAMDWTHDNNDADQLPVSPSLVNRRKIATTTTTPLAVTDATTTATADSNPLVFPLQDEPWGGDKEPEAPEVSVMPTPSRTVVNDVLIESGDDDIGSDKEEEDPDDGCMGEQDSPPVSPPSSSSPTSRSSSVASVSVASLSRAASCSPTTGGDGQEHYCLRWTNHGSHVLGVFVQLLRDESLVDVTLSAEGRSVRAHKMVLSACSSFFRTLFVQHADQRHPIIILKDTKFEELQSLIQFMYKGEVSVEYGQLATLLKSAENLRVKGLAEVVNSATAAVAAAAAARNKQQQATTSTTAGAANNNDGDEDEMDEKLDPIVIERTRLLGAPSSSVQEPPVDHQRNSRLHHRRLLHPYRSGNGRRRTLHPHLQTQRASTPPTNHRRGMTLVVDSPLLVSTDDQHHPAEDLSSAHRQRLNRDWTAQPQTPPQRDGEAGATAPILLVGEASQHSHRHRHSQHKNLTRLSSHHSAQQQQLHRQSLNSATASSDASPDAVDIALLGSGRHHNPDDNDHNHRFKTDASPRNSTPSVANATITQPTTTTADGEDVKEMLTSPPPLALINDTTAIAQDLRQRSTSSVGSFSPPLGSASAKQLHSQSTSNQRFSHPWMMEEESEEESADGCMDADEEVEDEDEEGEEDEAYRHQRRTLKPLNHSSGRRPWSSSSPSVATRHSVGSPQHHPMSLKKETQSDWAESVTAAAGTSRSDMVASAVDSLRSPASYSSASSDYGHHNDQFSDDQMPTAEVVIEEDDYINFSGADGLSTDAAATGKAATAIGDAARGASAGGSGKEMRHRTADRDMANTTSSSRKSSRQGSTGNQSSSHHHSQHHHHHQQQQQHQLLLQHQHFLLKQQQQQQQHHRMSLNAVGGGSHASRAKKPYHPFADGAATPAGTTADATSARKDFNDEMSVVFNRSLERERDRDQDRHRERDRELAVGRADISASSSSSFFSSLLPMVPPLDFAMRFGGMPMQFGAAAAAAAAAGLHLPHRNPSGGDDRRSGGGGGAASSRSGGSTPRPGPSSSSHQHPGDEERSSSNASDRIQCRDSPSSAASSSSAAAVAAAAGTTGTATASPSTTSTTTARSVASGFPFTTSISLIESHVGVGFTLGSREKPYKCEQCGQCYKYLSAFTKHKEQNHTARLPGEKPFRCEVCGMQFKYLKSFKKHRLNHAVERLHHVYPRSMPSAPRPPFPPPALVTSGSGGGGGSSISLGLAGGSIMEERSVLDMLSRSERSESHHHRHRDHQRHSQQQDLPLALSRRRSRSEERSPSSVRIKTEIEVVSSGEEESNAAEDEKSLGGSSIRERADRSSVYCPHCRSRFSNEDGLRTHISNGCPDRMHHLQQQQQHQQHQLQLQQQLQQHPGRMLLHPSLAGPGAISSKFPVGNPASNFLHGALQLQRQQAAQQQAAQATLLAVNYLAARAATASGNMPPPPGLERQVPDVHDQATGRTTSHDGEAASDREGSEDGDGSRSNSTRTSIGPSPATGAGPSAAGPWHNLIRDFSAAAAVAAAAAAASGRPPIPSMPNPTTAAAAATAHPPTMPVAAVAAAAAAASSGAPPPEYDPGRPHLCPFCGKGFRAKENLKLHIRKHTGERPFECEFCGRAFGGKSDMNRHLRIHTGERPYRCDACGKTFARADYLSKHLSTHLV